MSEREARFEDAIRASEDDLYRYFRRRMNDPSDAADAYSELLLTAWRRRRRMPAEPLPARMWLFGVAHNILRGSNRSAARYARAMQRLASEMRTTPPPESTERVVEIREALATLPPDQAELIRLVYWDGFRSHEAAAIVGLNASTARSRIAAAKAKLRLLLTAHPTDPEHIEAMVDASRDLLARR